MKEILILCTISVTNSEVSAFYTRAEASPGAGGVYQAGQAPAGLRETKMGATDVL